MFSHLQKKKPSHSECIFCEFINVTITFHLSFQLSLQLIYIHAAFMVYSVYSRQTSMKIYRSNKSGGRTMMVYLRVRVCVVQLIWWCFGVCLYVIWNTKSMHVTATTAAKTATAATAKKDDKIDFSMHSGCWIMSFIKLVCILLEQILSFSLFLTLLMCLAECWCTWLLAHALTSYVQSLYSIWYPI